MRSLIKLFAGRITPLSTNKQKEAKRVIAGSLYTQILSTPIFPPRTIF